MNKTITLENGRGEQITLTLNIEGHRIARKNTPNSDEVLIDIVTSSVPLEVECGVRAHLQKGVEMSRVADRIEKARACKVINLTEAEKDVYCGAGWKLARFEDGKLVELFDTMDLPYDSDMQRAADAIADATRAWIDTAAGEIWLVMCSCYQLCEPRRVTFDTLPHVMRVFADQLLEFYQGD